MTCISLPFPLRIVHLLCLRSSCACLFHAPRSLHLIGFYQDCILSSWGLVWCATWFWIKVTCQGELVSPLESPHKKPFEQLLIACRASEVHSCKVPNHKVLVSMPAQHSRKPFIGDIICKYTRNVEESVIPFLPALSRRFDFVPCQGS